MSSVTIERKQLEHQLQSMRYDLSMAEVQSGKLEKALEATAQKIVDYEAEIANYNVDCGDVDHERSALELEIGALQ